MNFFKTVFLDKDDENQDRPTSSNPPETITQKQNSGFDLNPEDTQPQSSSSSSSTFSFMSLMKTLQVNSDWIETYKRDLAELGTGIRRESELLKKVVKELPELSASKAQGPLESLGNVIDSVWKSASEVIISNSVLSDGGGGGDHKDSERGYVNVNVNYSRFERQLRKVQGDERTYVEEVEELEEYREWRKGFDLEGRRGEIEELMRENRVVSGVYEKVVGGAVVEDEVFWCRYFYKVFRLEKDEEVRARLVKRVIGDEDDEEELSWDVEDDEEGGEVGGNVSVSGRKSGESSRKGGECDEKHGECEEDEGVEVNGASVVSRKDEGLLRKEGECKERYGENEGERTEKYEKVDGGNEGKREPSESGKESDYSIVSTRPSTEGDDIGWDELEDIGTGDDRKVVPSGSSPSREVLRKRLSVAYDEEDLSWDIEDDDEPMKT